ncbi:hypothetical protein ACSFBF_06895 [Variovorax sp. ZT5P49]|uniref:hypothetical protein n=1 Tax=Variovorax sp. ZT5P49 TaxID=3443733 RepID=UPI003F460B1B
MTYTIYPNYIKCDDGVCFARDPEHPDYKIFEAWVAAGGVPKEPPEPSLEQRIAFLQAGVDEHLNAAAHAKRYDSIHTAALRAGYPGPFHDEGMAFAVWMDAVNAKCYEVLSQFMAGAIKEPSLEQLLAMLPALNLPDPKGA